MASLVLASGACQEGMVRLRVVLGPDGRVQSATVVQGAGWGYDADGHDPQARMRRWQQRW